MRITSSKPRYCCAFALVSLAALLSDAGAQTMLPEIVVTAPSPVRRPAAPRPSAPPAPAAPAAPLQIAVPPPIGALPIVTDQFATVTVVPNEELRRTPASTLGDLLFSKPGITGSSFAPGASSRPIIRGLDVNRVGIMENGTGAGGVSDLGEDHFVPINPLISNQIEVIRGPATLRYGSQSIGGVVSATNNRIPDAFPPCRDCGRLRDASRARLRDCAARRRRVDNGLEGGVLVDAAAGNVAIHADAFGRRAGDYRIPSYPYLFDQTRPFNGRQPNSAARTDGGSIGASYIFDQGFIGAAITQNNALYRIPGIDGEDHRTRIDAHETKSPARAKFVRRPTASMQSVSGLARPTTSTTRSALPIRRTRRATACARPSPTRSRRAASKSSSCRSTCASRSSRPRLACRPAISS